MSAKFNLTVENLIARDLLGIMVELLADQTRVYRDQNEDRQQLTIDRVRTVVTDAVAQAVRLMAARGHKAFELEVLNVTIKDGVKMQLGTYLDPSTLADLAHLYGKTILLIPYVPAEYQRDLHTIRPMADEPELPLGEEPVEGVGITAVPDMGAIAEHLEAEDAAAENAETDADHAQDYAEEPELPTAPRRRGRRSELGATLN